MALSKAATVEIMKNYQRSENDTGSPEVQIALLTQRILDLTVHMNQFKNDYHSRYGLKKLVAKRNRLLRYLKRINTDKYLSLIKRLGLRK